MSFTVLTLEDLAPAVTAHFNEPRAFSTGPVPDKPGVYVWARPEDQAIAYVGCGKSLSDRLGDELKWIKVHNPVTDWEVTVVHMLCRIGAEPHWIETATHEDALKLERDLIEWHRSCTGTAPLIVGWESKKNSPRGDSEARMHSLWHSVHGPAASQPAAQLPAAA